MENFKKLLHKEDSYSRQAASMMTIKHVWTDREYNKFSKLVEQIITLRKKLETNPNWFPDGSKGLH